VIDGKEYAVTSKASSKKPAKRSASAPESVDAFLASLEHPRKQEILALRQIILGADPGIAEGIKWNAPSFLTSEYFATMHLRAKDGVQVIMHLVAARARGTEGRHAGEPGDSCGRALSRAAFERSQVRLPNPPARVIYL
jgi:hypothetical protein